MTTLHVTNGDSAAETLRRTSLGGDVLPWRDVLNEGPVPRERLNEVRAAFLAENGFGERGELLADLQRRDATVAAAEHVVLWFEHDLYDQLQLVQALADHVRAPVVEYVPSDRFLGTLTAAELEELWPQRRPVTPGIADEARRAWAAVRAPDPRPLENFVLQQHELPFLGPALRRLLEELPHADDGLARSERQLLAALADGPLSAHELFLASQRPEEAAFDGDTWVWRRAQRLSPLVANGDAYALTDAGRAVLAGEADALELLELDRWVGGTHLTPPRAWRWDGSRVVPPRCG